MAPSLPSLQLLPLQCHKSLCHLCSQAADLPIDSVVRQLCHILGQTVQGKSYVYKQDLHYPTRCRVWNSHYVNMVIEALKNILTILYKVTREKDLKTLTFNPHNLETGVNNVIKFVNIMYSKYVSILMPYKARKSMEEQTTDVGKVRAICCLILSALAYKIRFEKRPTVTNITSPLWKKLHRTASVLSLLDTNTFPVCPMCFANELKEDGHFAILDCCHHLVCTNCAKKLFDVRSYQESRCPSCHLSVSAWTDSEHFRRFKSQCPVRTKMWVAAQRVKSALP